MSVNQNPKVETGSAKQIQRRVQEGYLLDAQAPSILRIPSGPGGTGQVWGQCFVARHSLVLDVLAQPEHFHAGHYDRLMEALGSRLRVLAGADDNQRARMRHVLNQAMRGHRPESGGLPVSHSEWLNAIAKEKSREVLSILSNDLCGEQPFNLVWEYALIVPYLVFAEFLGTRFPVRSDLGAKIANFARNFLKPDPPVRLQGVQGEAWTLVLWGQLFFAQLFGNFNNGTAIRALAKYGLKKLSAHIRFGMENRSALASGGFLAAILNANDAQAGADKLNADDISAIFLEMLGTALLLPGFAFCQLQAALHDDEFKQSSKIDFDRFVAQINSGNGAANWQSQFDELFRLMPLTTRMDRVARSVNGKDAVIDGVSIPYGDRITLLVAKASKDPRVFSSLPSGKLVDPEVFSPDNNRPYLEFRPKTAPRQCFGRDWTLGLFQEMFSSLEEFKVRPVKGCDGKLTRLGESTPDRMMVHFQR